jgi:hypothetical protein
MHEDLIAENIAQVLSRQSELSPGFIEEISHAIRSQLRTESDYKYMAKDNSESGGQHRLDYNSDHSSIPDNARRGKQVTRRVASVDSEPYLDSVIDIAIDTDVSDRPTMVIGRKIPEDEYVDASTFTGEWSDSKNNVHVNDAGR